MCPIEIWVTQYHMQMKRKSGLSVRRVVGCLVDWFVVRSVCHKFLKGQEIKIPCFYRSICFLVYLYFYLKYNRHNMIFDINIFYFFTSFVVNIFLFEFGKVSNVFLIFRGNMVGGYLGAKRERGVKNTPPHRREIPPPPLIPSKGKDTTA